MSHKKLVLSQEQIKKRVAELGRQITKDFQQKDLLIIGVLNGAFVFMADLIRLIDLPMQIDFLRVASYGAKSTAGTINFTKDIELPITGKTILLVEDIIDTGRTISFLKDHFQQQGAENVFICTLIDKKERRLVDVAADYSGFDIAEGFLVGYGLDFAEQYRYLPEIFHLENPEQNH